MKRDAWSRVAERWSGQVVALLVAELESAKRNIHPVTPETTKLQRRWIAINRSRARALRAAIARLEAT